MQSAFHGLSNLHLSNSQHQLDDEHDDDHTSVLDTFAALPQGKRNELSLNPKYEQQQLDYTVTDTHNDNTADTALPPSAPGGYLEPSSHFYVSGIDSPQHTFQQLYHLLSEWEDVDCDMCPDGWKMRCEAYRECARVEFLVRLFHTPDNPRGEFAVEFQRRFGDGMVFHNLYAEVKKAVEKKLSMSHASPQHNNRAAAPVLSAADVPAAGRPARHAVLPSGAARRHLVPAANVQERLRGREGQRHHCAGRDVEQA